MAYASITKPSLHFNTVTYTGDGSSGRAVTGVGFQPDWVWIKSRSGTHNAANHRVYDAVRGVTKVIYANLNNAEGTDAQGLTAFGTDGFTLGTENQSNGSNTEFVAWNWKAGNSAGSANNDGTTTSTVTTNTTAGFSIIKYTGNTGTNSIGHGLGATPAFFVTKGYGGTHGWVGWHQDLAGGSGINDRYVYFNSNNAGGNTSGYWGGGSGITSSTIGLWSSGGDNNANGVNYIMYAFAEKKGFSKFGLYTGNGSTNGPFIYTGFKPALFMHKRRDDTGAFYIYDNKRPGYNPIDNTLSWASAAAEDTNTDYNDVEFYANGVKIIEDNPDINTTGNPYIYIAFAENPFIANVGTNGIPATAG